MYHYDYVLAVRLPTDVILQIRAWGPDEGYARLRRDAFRAIYRGVVLTVHRSVAGTPREHTALIIRTALKRGYSRREPLERMLLTVRRRHPEVEVYAPARELLDATRQRPVG